MSTEHKPAHPPFLEPHCVAAAALFGRATLRKIREANEPGLRNTPEGAIKLHLAEIYDGLVLDMTRLAVELGQGGKRHAQD